VRKDEVLQRVKKERNTVQTIKRRKANRICHILQRNCLLKHVIEGKREVRGRRGRRCVKLLGDLNEMKGYWILKYETLDRTMWRTRFGRGYGTVTRYKTQ
jgi:hypothetical protein